MEEHELIEEFILAVQEEFPQLDMKFDYSEVAEEYEIIFDTTVSDYPRQAVTDTMNELASEMLVGEGIFNFFLCQELVMSQK